MSENKRRNSPGDDHRTESPPVGRLHSSSSPVMDFVRIRFCLGFLYLKVYIRLRGRSSLEFRTVTMGAFMHCARTIKLSN